MLVFFKMQFVSRTQKAKLPKGGGHTSIFTMLCVNNSPHCLRAGPGVGLFMDEMYDKRPWREALFTPDRILFVFFTPKLPVIGINSLIVTPRVTKTL
jgi:hypothetical protein